MLYQFHNPRWGIEILRLKTHIDLCRGDCHTCWGISGSRPHPDNLPSMISHSTLLSLGAFSYVESYERREMPSLRNDTKNLGASCW